MRVWVYLYTFPNLTILIIRINFRSLPIRAPNLEDFPTFATSVNEPAGEGIVKGSLSYYKVQRYIKYTSTPRELIAIKSSQKKNENTY